MSRRVAPASLVVAAETSAPPVATFFALSARTPLSLARVRELFATFSAPVCSLRAPCETPATPCRTSPAPLATEAVPACRLADPEAT